MRWMPPLFAVIAMGCGAGESGSRAPLVSEREDEAASTRPAHEARAATEVNEGATAPVLVPAAVEVPRELMTLSLLEGSQPAEDGAGNVAPSERAVAVDLDAARFPPRALDPVLTIGALRFTHYRHPAIGVLRFVIASQELLVDGAEVAVQYGELADTRTVVSPSLTVPSEVRR